MMSRRQSDAGMSLLSLIVSIGITGILALAISSMIRNGIAGNRHVELRGGLEDIRRSVRTRLSCEAATTACAGGADFVTPVDAKGRPLWEGKAGAQGAKVGDWNMRLRCVAGVPIPERARISGSGFVKDPLTNKQYGWEGVFPPELSPCEGSSTSETSRERGQFLVWRRYVTSTSREVGSPFCVTPNTVSTESGCHCPKANPGKTITPKLLSTFGSLGCAFYHTAHDPRAWSGEAGPDPARTCMSETFVCVEK